MSLVQRQDIELRGQLVATSQHWLGLVSKVTHKVRSPVTATYWARETTQEPIQSQVPSTKDLYDTY